jgi:uncharacterized protein (TIGR03083 family)
MDRLQPIFVTDLFPKLNLKLIELLESLSDEEWSRPTVCSLWNVKDIASHLLDGYIRRLSIDRDRYLGDKPDKIDSYQNLVDYLNRLNADWVRAAKRVSPKILIELLDQYGKEVYEFFKTLDPFQTAAFPVAWAGEERSENWFDIARDYTEHWHHQQQIRLAIDRPGIMERELYFPVLDTFMRALPYTYRNRTVDENYLLRVHIAGEAGGDWLLLRKNQTWNLIKNGEFKSNTEVIIDQGLAWRIFTKGIDRQSAKEQIIIEGDQDLGSEIINMLSVMA